MGWLGVGNLVETLHVTSLHPAKLMGQTISFDGLVDPQLLQEVGDLNTRDPFNCFFDARATSLPPEEYLFY
jgi:hypothetical protein